MLMKNIIKTALLSAFAISLGFASQDRKTVEVNLLDSAGLVVDTGGNLQISDNTTLNLTSMSPSHFGLRGARVVPRALMENKRSIHEDYEGHGITVSVDEGIETCEAVSTYGDMKDEDVAKLKQAHPQIPDTIQHGCKICTPFIHKDVEATSLLEKIETKVDPTLPDEAVHSKQGMIYLKKSLNDSYNQVPINLDDFRDVVVEGNAVGEVRAAFVCPANADGKSLNVQLEQKVVLSGDNRACEDTTVFCNGEVMITETESMPQSDIVIAKGAALSATKPVSVGKGKTLEVNGSLQYQTLTLAEGSSLVL